MTTYTRTLGGNGPIDSLAAPMITRKEWKRKNSILTWCSIFQTKLAITQHPGTAECRRKAILSVFSVTFGCYQLDCPQTEMVGWNSTCQC